MILEQEELEGKTRQLLWEFITELDNKLQAKKVLLAKPLREFNRAFQNHLQIFNKMVRNE